jgi:RHS repeat-associated protein
LDGLGIYAIGARWYDPALARWLSPDTLVPEPGNPQSLNRYSWVLGNPLKFVDPTGHKEEGACAPGDENIVCTTQEAMYGDYEPLWTYCADNPGDAVCQPTATPEEAALFFVVTVSGAELAFGIFEVGGAYLVGLISAASAHGDPSNEAVSLLEQAKNLCGRLGNLFDGAKKLPSDIAGTLQNGEYSARILDKDMIVFWAEGTEMGRWFGNIKPDSAAMAERLYNVAIYGNDLLHVSTYQIPAGTLIYEGPVAGGTGRQIFVDNPWAVGVQWLATEFLPQWGH